MSATFLVSVANLLVLLLFPVCAVVWFRILLRRRFQVFGGEPLIEPEPRRRPFWTPWIFLLWLGLALVLSPILYRGLAAFGWIEWSTAGEGPPRFAPTTRLAIGSAVFLLATLGTAFILSLQAPRRFEDLGLIPRWSDVRLGLSAAVLILPPLMLLMAAVSWLVPYEHEVLEALEQEESLSRFAVLFVATVFVTPIVEEFAMRVLLQGSLQGLAGKWRQQPEPTVTPDSETSFVAEPSPSSQDGSVEGSPVSDGPTGMPSGYDARVRWAYRPESGATATQAAMTQVNEQGDSLWTPHAFWPILVVSIVFALLHTGQGLAPIPLFFLSLALGYLYRQTGRITAPVIVHMTLNGITMVVTILTLISE